MATIVKIEVPTGKIRQEPRPDGQVLLELTYGQELELLEHKPRYSQVRYRDHYQETCGWIANVAIGLPDKKGIDPSSQMPITCPFCGSEAWVEKSIRTSNSPIMLGGGFLFGGHYAHSRICTGCGYVQLHVGQEDLQELREESKE